MVLVLRHKAARVKARDVHQGGSPEPVPEPTSRDRGRGGRGKRGRGGGQGSDDPYESLPGQPWGLHMDASGW
eukprot:2084617-Alexandrium_andersonii.AAC.1